MWALTTYRLVIKSMKKCVTLFAKKINISWCKYITVPLLLTTTLTHLCLTNIIFYTRWSVLLVIITTTYLITNLWFFFQNNYVTGNYTSDEQRFWKRSFSTIWSIEFFLFTVFLFLYLIAPTEDFYFKNLKHNTHQQWLFSNCSNKQLFWVVFITTTLYVTLFLKKNNNPLFNLTLLLTFYGLSVLVLLELQLVVGAYNVNFSKTLQNVPINSNTVVYITNSPNNTVTGSLVYNKKTVLLSTSTINTSVSPWQRSSQQNYTTLLLVLRFWHVLLIYLYFYFIWYKATTNSTYRLSYDNLSSSYQNIIYLFLFIVMFEFIKLKPILRTYLYLPYSGISEKLTITGFLFLYHEFYV